MGEAHFGDLPVLIPPVEEQKAIVQHLDDATRDVEKALNRARREIQLILEYRTRLVSDVVTGKLDVRRVNLPVVDESELDLDELEPIETEDLAETEGASIADL